MASLLPKGQDKIMQTYEINLWQEKKIIEKVVKQFESDEEVLDFIKDNYDKKDELPRLDQEKAT